MSDTAPALAANVGGFLRRLTIEQVRAFEHVELNFEQGVGSTRQWTYVMGLNGSGKSTILRAIALVTAGSQALAELLASPADWVRHGSPQARITADLVTAEGEPRHIELTIGREDTLKDVYVRNDETLAPLDAALRHAARNYLVVGYGAHRRPAPVNFSGLGASSFSNPRSRSVATLFSPDALLQPIESWAISLDYRDGEGFNRARETLDRLLPGVTFTGIDKVRGELLFATPDGPMPFRLLSDGYQNVASWSGDLLGRVMEVFGDRADPLAARGLLMIDEIGLHLHPQWQRQLTEFLSEKLPNFQFIVTTHSPLTAHQAAEGELFVVDRSTSTGASRVSEFPGAPRTLLLHQFLMTPAFGVETADSRLVEGMKAEYRRISTVKGPTKRQRARLVELQTALGDLPEWSSRTGRDSELTSLLKDVRRELSDSPGGRRATDGGTPATARPARRRGPE